MPPASAPQPPPTDLQTTHPIPLCAKSLQTVNVLADGGVKFLAMRCAGFDRVRQTGGPKALRRGRQCGRRQRRVLEHSAPPPPRSHPYIRTCMSHVLVPAPAKPPIHARIMPPIHSMLIRGPGVRAARHLCSAASHTHTDATLARSLAHPPTHPLTTQVDLAACAERGIKVVRVPAYSPRSVAEHAFALSFTLARWVGVAVASWLAACRLARRAAARQQWQRPVEACQSMTPPPPTPPLMPFRRHPTGGRELQLQLPRARMGNYTLNGLIGVELSHKTYGVIGTGNIGIEVRVLFGGKSRTGSPVSFLYKLGDVSSRPDGLSPRLSTVLLPYAAHCSWLPKSL